MTLVVLRGIHRAASRTGALPNNTHPVWAVVLVSFYGMLRVGITSHMARCMRWIPGAGTGRLLRCITQWYAYRLVAGVYGGEQPLWRAYSLGAACYLGRCLVPSCNVTLTCCGLVPGASGEPVVHDFALWRVAAHGNVPYHVRVPHEDHAS